MTSVLNFLSRNKKIYPSVTLFLGLVLVTVVGIVDGITGSEYSFSAFYLIPVVLTAWYAGRVWAVLVAVAGAVAWLAADVAGGRYYETPFAIIWNDGIELCLYLFAALVISSLKGRLDHEQELSRTDHLTGIANRRCFNELAGDEIRRSRRYLSPFTLIYLDIDNFKVVNDTQGHSEGDRLLRQVARTLRDNLRESDMVARLGGDEFALLLPETDAGSAPSVAAKLRGLLASEVESRWPVSFSIGMVTYLSAPTTVDEMIRTADLLMYETKSCGKDGLRQVVVQGEDATDGMRFRH